MRTLNEVWVKSCAQYRELPVVYNRHDKSIRVDGKIQENVEFKPVSYKTLDGSVKAFAHGLIALGIGEQEAVAIIAENSMKWLVCDLAVLANRCYDVPRGCSSTDKELLYILAHSEARIVIVEDAVQLDRLQALKSKLNGVETIIVLAKKTKDRSGATNVYFYEEVMALGRAYWKKAANKKKNELNKRREKTTAADIATLMYTSGTSGQPKGIPLTHGNIMHNIETVPFMLNVHSDDIFLSILPIWHTFERTNEYGALRVGASIAYTTQLTIVKDLGLMNPTYMASVPRIWIAIYNNVMSTIKRSGKEKLFRKLYEHSLIVMQARRYSENRQYLLGRQHARPVKVKVRDYFFHYLAQGLIYRKVREELGNKFTAAISGGGSLPRYIDDFFEVIGVPILEGYGLTETSPIITCRTFTHGIPYTCGSPLPQTEINICSESGQPVPEGEKGCVWVSGPQVMHGYYKNKKETSRVLKTDKTGQVWFNTGDLGVISKYGDLTILGRLKDTIVLIGGENVEPEPIEAAILKLDEIDQVMIVGQDQEFLTALIVPNATILRSHCKEQNIKYDPKNIPRLAKEKKITAIFMNLIRATISPANSFKEIEKVQRMVFTHPFTPDDDTLTQTQKIKRHKVVDRDEELIKTMYPRYNQIHSKKVP